MNSRNFILVSISLVLFFNINIAHAEDCTGVLPTADCTLDEDTTAALTIDNFITLTIGASVNLNHTIDSSLIGLGTIETDGSGVVVIQNEATGGITNVDSITINDGDTWTANADIITNTDFSNIFFGGDGDIDMGVIDGGEVLNLNGGITVSGLIDGNTGDFVNIGADLTGGTFTMTGGIQNVDVSIDSGDVVTDSNFGSVGNSLSSLFIAAGSTLTTSGGNNNASVIDLDGTLELGAASTFTIDNYTADANNGTVIFELISDGSNNDGGTVFFGGGGPVDLSNMNVGVDINTSSTVLLEGTIPNVFIGDNGPTTLPTLVENSFIFDFSLVQNGDNVDLVIDRLGLAGAANSPSNREALISLFDGMFNADDPVVQATQQNLMNATNKRQFNEILESTYESMDMSLKTASDFVTNKTINLAQERLDYLRKKGRRFEGYSSGSDLSDENGVRVWSQVFGGTGDQGRREEIDGYDFDSAGFSVGVDTGGVHPNLIMGASLTYASSDVSGRDANKKETNIDHYLAAVYGTYFTENEYFINGMLVWGLNEANMIRNNVGFTGRRAIAQYDGEQITAYAEIGGDYRNSNVVATPSIVSRYSYFEVENYRERGAGGMNVTGNHDAVHAFEMGPKFDVMLELEDDSGLLFIPELTASYKYDFIGDTARARAMFEEDRATLMGLEGFSSQNHTFNLGTGLNIYDEDWEINLNYDYERKGELFIHSGLVRGAYKFN
jgi:uncharacterized protein with beta-barrel porin domain